MAPGLLVIMKLKEMSKQGAKYGYYGLSITRVCPLTEPRILGNIFAINCPLF